MTSVQEYADRFDATASPFYKRSNFFHDSRFVNAALALASEVCEYNLDPGIDELGDIIWYHAMCCKQAGFVLEEVYAGSKTVFVGGKGFAINVAVGGLLSHLKKCPEKGIEHNWGFIGQCLSEIAAAIGKECANHRTLILNVMTRNLEKLAARHKGAYDPNQCHEKSL